MPIDKYKLKKLIDQEIKNIAAYNINKENISQEKITISNCELYAVDEKYTKGIAYTIRLLRLL